MIKSFADKDTETLFLTGKCRKLPADIWRSGLRALRALDAATSLADLRGDEPRRPPRRGEEAGAAPGRPVLDPRK